MLSSRPSPGVGSARSSRVAGSPGLVHGAAPVGMVGRFTSSLSHSSPSWMPPSAALSATLALFWFCARLRSRKALIRLAAASVETTSRMTIVITRSIPRSFPSGERRAPPAPAIVRVAIVLPPHPLRAGIAAHRAHRTFPGPRRRRCRAGTDLADRRDREAVDLVADLRGGDADQVARARCAAAVGGGRGEEAVD